MQETDRSWVGLGLDEAAYLSLARGMPRSRLWSLLLSIVESRASQRKPADVQTQWESDRFVQPSYIDQRTLTELDVHLWAAANDFESLELSPVAPLGACSGVAPTSQNRIVSTVRGTEVVSDPTNVLALESARRLRLDSSQAVHLATSHRCVRAQQVPNRPGFAAHFRMFCMASAGHERKDHRFTTEALVRHIHTYLNALRRLEEHGYEFPNLRLVLLATHERAALRDRIASQVQGLPIVIEPLEHGYYDGLRFMINAGSASDAGIPLIDGGTFDWVAKLASNNKLAYVASALGSQLVAYLFRATQAR